MRANTAARHELDLAGALPQLLADAQTNFVGALGDRGDALTRGVAERAARLPRQLEEEAEITVARGLRDGSARRMDAGTGRDAFIDRPLQSEDRPAKVADRP